MKRTDIIKATANSLNIYSFTAEALERLIEAVKEEQSCPTCEALARTVMLDQTSHDAPRKPLTDESIRIMHEMLEVQGQHGNWNYDSYMHGLYNGMEYMVALAEKREPQFRDAPKEWLAKREVKRDNFNSTVEVTAAHGIMSVPDGKGEA